MTSIFQVGNGEFGKKLLLAAAAMIERQLVTTGLARGFVRELTDTPDSWGGVELALRFQYAPLISSRSVRVIEYPGRDFCKVVFVNHDDHGSSQRHHYLLNDLNISERITAFILNGAANAQLTSVAGEQAYDHWLHPVGHIPRQPVREPSYA